MGYEMIIDRVMEHFSSPPFVEEAVMAKLAFSEWAGNFDEMSPDFEVKVAQFTDWYLFVRPCGDWARPPIQWTFKESGLKLKPAWSDLYERLVTSRCSLFEFLKVKKNDLYIKDIFSGYKFTIKDSPIIHGLTKGDIFEARLIADQEGFVFSNSFCFHPPQAVRYIEKEVKKVQLKSFSDEVELEAARRGLVHKLFCMRYKVEYYKHVSIGEIYTDKPNSFGKSGVNTGFHTSCSSGNSETL